MPAIKSEKAGHLLTKVCELRHRRMHKLLDDLGLYKGQPSMLRILWAQEGMSHTELAEQLNRCPATITKMVQRMEKAGLVERRTDPKDERVSRVYLTGRGYSIRSEVEEVWHAFEAQAFSSFTQEELDLLHHLLLRVCDNIRQSA
jgi:DNA-binding MarR family transcriptional regulator